jgi:hypothetical protein
MITLRQGRVLHATRLGFTELAQTKPQNRLSEHVHHLVAWFWQRHGSTRHQTGGLLYSTVVTIRTTTSTLKRISAGSTATLAMVSVVLLSTSRQLPG